jgi:hypothetical protein
MNAESSKEKIHMKHKGTFIRSLLSIVFRVSPR